MMKRDYKNVQYLDRWKDKFGFNGKLTTESCSKLVKDIEKVGQKDRKLNDKNGLTQARAWLAEENHRKQLVKYLTNL